MICHSKYSIQDVYSGDGIKVGDDEESPFLVHPICLPPFGPVDWDMTQSDFTKDQPGLYPWLRNTTALIPFEDMDCVATFRSDPEVPVPSNVKVSRKGLILTMTMQCLRRPDGCGVPLANYLVTRMIRKLPILWEGTALSQVLEA